MKLTHFTSAYPEDMREIKKVKPFYEELNEKYSPDKVDMPLGDDEEIGEKNELFNETENHESMYGRKSAYH